MKEDEGNKRYIQNTWSVSLHCLVLHLARFGETKKRPGRQSSRLAMAVAVEELSSPVSMSSFLSCRLGAGTDRLEPWGPAQPTGKAPSRKCPEDAIRLFLQEKPRSLAVHRQTNTVKVVWDTVGKPLSERCGCLAVGDSARRAGAIATFARVVREPCQAPLVGFKT